MLRWLLLSTLLCHASCDTKSKAEPYAELTLQEEGRKALDAEDYAAAIVAYNKAIEADPTDYESYRFLAASYAGEAGFDLLDAVAGTLSPDKGGGKSNLLDTLGDFVPADPTDDQIEAMRLSKETLLRLPPEYRDKDNTDIESASSAAQQLEFYQAAYSVITINKFAKVDPTSGSLDPAQLETMTDEDVEAILGNLEELSETSSDGAVGEGVSEILAQVDAAPGGSRREKLIDYLANK